MLIRQQARTIVLFLVVGGTLAACGNSSTTSSTNSACSSIPTVTSHGQGSALGTPDMATVDLGVQTQESTATAALDQNSSNTSGLLKALSANGVSKSDVQTSGLSLHGIYGGPTPTITGYQVTNTVTVQIHNVSSTGTIIDSAAKAAGNSIRINQITFSVKDSSALFDQARAQAVSQAATEANAMAKAAGKHLGALCSLNDSAPSSQPLNTTNYSTAAGVPASVPIQEGSQKVKATVTAVYQLQP
ncbi:MAG: DUF541 domain-containing protein [Actinomycetota bacterium]|nr:MAG: DUF541 domain-containing protein [Actinomycetota bacterium]